MNCTFFGHKDATDEVKFLLRESILCLMKKESVEKFLVGNNGNFDFYVQCVLQELKEAGVDRHFDIVLSHLGEEALSGLQTETIFPEGLERAIPKFAISKRNDWMINNSSVVIAYVKHDFSNSSKWIEKAAKKGLRFINLADGSSNKETNCGM